MNKLKKFISDLKKFKFLQMLKPTQSELEAFLFSAPESLPQKSPIPSKFPNPSNKTGEDLQELIEEIPYPTEDLSLTSFSNSSSNTNALKRPKPSQKAFYTSFGSDHKDNKTPIHIKFERYQSQQQKDESFDDEDDLSNLPNFESLTPHRINQIMDWSKQHVTPGDSKHIFPQVIAPSIEFSHDTSAYLSKCLMTEQMEGNNEQIIENPKEKNVREKTHKENKRPVGFIQENANDYQKPANLMKKFDEKANKNEEKPQIFEEKYYFNEDSSQRVDRVFKQEAKTVKSQTQYQKPDERSQRFTDISHRFDERSHIYDEKSQRFDEKSQRFDQKSQRIEEKPQLPTNFILEKFEEKPQSFQDSSQRIDFDRIRLFCERLESQCQAKDNLLQKKDQETFTLVSNIKELEEELALLRESKQENSNLELLRGKNLEASRKELKSLRKELEQKQSFINDLMSQVESLKHSEICLQESLEKELGFLSGEIEKHKALSQGYKRKAIEIENHLKQILDQKEMENTDFERKIEAISQGYEELSMENEALKGEKTMMIQDIEGFKKKIKAHESEIESIREENKILKEKEELMYQGTSNELLKEKSSLEKDLHEEIERLRKAYEKTTKELEEIRSSNHQKDEDNTRTSINKLVLTEASFGKNDSKGLLMGSCGHRAILENFFMNIGYKEEGGSESLEGKNFEELINLLHNIFNHLQEQFEALFNERNEMADSLAKIMDRENNKRDEIDEEQYEKEKEIHMKEVQTKIEEMKKIQEILNAKISENFSLNEGIQKLKEELNTKNEILEVFETRQKTENPEILIRNSETFQVLTQKYEENTKKYNDLSENYQKILHKFDDLSQKYDETTQKCSEASNKCAENFKEINALKKEKAFYSESLEQKKSELSQKTAETKTYVETIENQKSLINSLKSEKHSDFSIVEGLKSQIAIQKNEIFSLKSENSRLSSEISILKAEIDNEKTVSESHRMSALDFSKKLEILTGENEDLKELLKQQGDKIEELTKLIDEDFDSKTKLEDLQLDAKDFSEKIMEENVSIKKEIEENHKIIGNFEYENETMSMEIKGLKEKIDEITSENERFRQDLSLKNERLRVSDENNDSLKEKDKKNIQLFKENKALLENLKVLEETNNKDKQELERKGKNLTQKLQEVKNLTQGLKEKNEELLEEKKRSEIMKFQIEELMKNHNEKKGHKDKENMAKISIKLKQNDEELKEIKKMFINEKEKLFQKIKEIEHLKEKTLKENVFLNEANQISKERIVLLEKNLKENQENNKPQKCHQSFWCPEMLSNEETVETMLELLRRIIGSTEILGVLNENSEILILLKRLMKNFNGEWSQENSKFIKRLI